MEANQHPQHALEHSICMTQGSGNTAVVNSHPQLLRAPLQRDQEHR